MEKLLILLMIVCTPAAARPNWGSLTDGWSVLDLDGDTHAYRLSIDRTLWLSQVGGGIYTVDSLPPSAAETIRLAVAAGDTVMHNDFGLFFFNAKGRAYASMKTIQDYEDPVQMRRRDSLAVVRGVYRWTGGKTLLLDFSADGNPQLTIGGGQPEPISFEPDVQDGQCALMHIKTPRRRLLLMPTKTGLSIYQAVWDKHHRCYVRGGLLRHAIRQSGLPVSTLFVEHEGLPFLDILTRYYSDDMLLQLALDFDRTDPQSPFAPTLLCFVAWQLR